MMATITIIFLPVVYSLNLDETEDEMVDVEETTEVDSVSRDSTYRTSRDNFECRQGENRQTKRWKKMNSHYQSEYNQRWDIKNPGIVRVEGKGLYCHWC